MSSADYWIVGISIVMTVHLIIGLPLFVVLGLGSVALILVSGFYSISVVGEVPFQSMDSWALLAMPLFILAGDIISVGWLARALVGLGQALLGWLRGGLGMATIGGCFFLSGTSGSNSADTAAIGRIMVPRLVAEGYDRAYAAALAASGGCLGIIVPPSLMFIIYGVVTSTSVGDLFLGGILPGVVMAAAMCFANYLVCRNSNWGSATERFSLRGTGRAFWEARYGLGAPLVILGGIYSGQFTPTEAAAVAVIYCLLIEIYVNRAVKWSQVPQLLVRSGIVVGVIAPVIMFSVLFGEALSVLRIPDRLASALIGWATSPITLLAIVMVILLIVGCFLETIAAIIILMPILAPAAAAFNIDPVHFGVFVMCALTIGYITPPVGINLFVASAVTGVPYLKIAWRAWPLFVALVLATVIVGLVPWLSIWFR